MFLVPALAVTAFSAALAFSQMRAVGGFGRLDALLLVPLTLSSGYVAFQSWQVVLGLFARFAPQNTASDHGARTLPADFRRLAVVVPICDEDVAAVFGALAAIRRSMAEAGLHEAEVFILSDTRAALIAAAEDAAMSAARAQAQPLLHYRRRTLNARRKVGNVAEFCATHGARFELMLVLDADSLMSGQAIRRMAEAMFAEPNLGLVQTLCFPARRATLFARIQQFAARLYAPLHTGGMRFWTGGDGIYWGHNAMIRVAPFQRFCELPILSGAPPLGGEILCHDVVESAFLRRAGWDVRILPEIEGTWEDMPSNTLDFAARDRRWCQGNLQHARLLAEPGLTWPCRYHMLNGIFAYASAPIWLLFLVLGTAQVWLGTERSNPGAEATLLAPGAAAPLLFTLSLAVIFLPKALSLALVLASRRERARFGGASRLVASAVAETAFGILWSPMTLLFYTEFVLATLAGRIVRWDPQSREDRGVSWREAGLRHRWHTLLGVAWGVTAFCLDPTIFLWMSPLFAGLILSVPLTVLSSRTSLGLAAARLGLFLTPDETDPAPELAGLPDDIRRVGLALDRAAFTDNPAPDGARPAARHAWNGGFKEADVLP